MQNHTRFTLNRRRFLYTLGGGVPAALTLSAAGFAEVPSASRFVFVLLRGGVDGLAAVVPVGDPAYPSTRGEIAFGADGLFVLDDLFRLAPGLAPLGEFWDRNELHVLHAMAIPYRTRSHFDGQAILETGMDRPDGSSDGWLNRLLQVMGSDGAGIAVAAGLPRSLSGDHPVTTWSPANLGAVDDGYIDRLHLLYRHDPRLLNAFEAALQLGDMAAVESGMSGMRRAARGPMTPVFTAAARFIREPNGPNVAALEFNGWDTHANQGVAGGQLDNLLRQLADGLSTFRNEMGALWPGTRVVVMTEFGRTARPNGTRGTDHGTAGMGLVLGSGLGRSRVIADWPGLGDSDLFDGRDLAPTLDTRAVLKGVLASTFDLTPGQLNQIFPGSDALRPVDIGLL